MDMHSFITDIRNMANQKATEAKIFSSLKYRIINILDNVFT
jgi:hypothetical protein